MGPSVINRHQLPHQFGLKCLFQLRIHLTAFYAVELVRIFLIVVIKDNGIFLFAHLLEIIQNFPDIKIHRTQIGNNSIILG